MSEIVEHVVDDFIRKTTEEGRRLALVTSGGTRVNLEKNAVRFIENFSMGNRGAASSEYFLEHNYSVIFFHREGTLKPFSRRLPNLFDSIQLDSNGVPKLPSDSNLAEAVKGRVKYAPYILYLTFTTIDEYLRDLVAICKRINSMGSKAILYLAAAVSDFYIREEKLPTHKIQSQEGDVQLNLSVVTKILDRLVNAIVPNAFIISFKLETDPEILVSKAQKALQRYGHSLVIGNILMTRKKSVVFVQPGSVEPLDMSQSDLDAGVEIENGRSLLAYAVAAAANIQKHCAYGLKIGETAIIRIIRHRAALFLGRVVASSCARGMTTRPKILVTDQSVNIEKLREFANVVQYEGEGQMPRDDLLVQSRDVDGLFCLLRDKVDSEFLSNCKKLKCIGTMSVGYEHVDVEECKKRGIKVGNTPGVLTESTAMLGVSLLLSVSRRIVESHLAMKSGQWTTWKPYWMCGKDLNGSTVGFYGLGAIGQRMAEMLNVFGPGRIIYHNRRRRDEVSYDFVPFEELLNQSDFLIVTAAATAENRQIFDLKAFSRMKKDSIFINISRGILVKTGDLCLALQNGIIGAAGLDVTDPEPLPNDHRLLTLPNALVIPHIGSATFATRHRMAEMTVDNIFNYFHEKPMISAVVE